MAEQLQYHHASIATLSGSSTYDPTRFGPVYHFGTLYLEYTPATEATGCPQRPCVVQRVVQGPGTIHTFGARQSIISRTNGSG